MRYIFLAFILYCKPTKAINAENPQHSSDINCKISRNTFFYFRHISSLFLIFISIICISTARFYQEIMMKVYFILVNMKIKYNIHINREKILLSKSFTILLNLSNLYLNLSLLFMIN